MINKKIPTYMLTYDHGGAILWGTDKFKERLRDGISWLERYPSFKMGLDNEAFVYDEFARQNPEIIEELVKYLKKYQGRFGIGSCTYGQPLSTFISEESNVRQLTYAISTNLKYFSYTPPIYVMSEHANHSQIPQLLKGTEYKGAIMRTHYMMYGYNPTYNEAFGWWIGVDGSRIPTVPTYEGEGADFAITTLDNWVLTRWPKKTNSSIEEYCEKFSNIQPLLASRYDDADLRCEELVAHCEGNDSFKWILLDELLSYYPKPLAEFITKPNDFTVRMPWGYCGNEIWNMSRQAEIQLLTAERIASMELLLGGEGHGEDLKEAWKSLLVSQHHDVQICGLLGDSRKHLSESLEISKKVYDTSMNFIGKRMKGNGLYQVTVFNPVSWSRLQLIQVQVNFLKKDGVKQIKVMKDGNEIPSRTTISETNSGNSIKQATVEFTAVIPGLGFEAYAIEGSDCLEDSQLVNATELIEVDENNLTIKTCGFEAKLDSSGGITSISDRNTGKIYVGQKGGNSIFTAIIDDKEYESKGTWVIKNTGNKAIAREIGYIGSIPYEFRMTFYSDMHRIDCHVKLNFNGEKVGKTDGGFSHEEKLSFKLYPNISDKCIGVRDLPFVIEETNNKYVEGNYWTALTDNNIGIAYFNKGTMGSVRGSDGSFSIPIAYANSYIWGTRMLNGDFQYDFAIYPFIGAWQEADLHRQALEYNFPTVVTAGQPGDGNLGTEIKLMELNSDNIIVSAIYPDKDNILVRMYEYKGISGEAEFKFHEDNVALAEVNLLGHNKKQINDPLKFEPWEIKTIQIDNRKF